MSDAIWVNEITDIIIYKKDQWKLNILKKQKDLLNVYIHFM